MSRTICVTDSPIDTGSFPMAWPPAGRRILLSRQLDDGSGPFLRMGPGPIELHAARLERVTQVICHEALPCFTYRTLRPFNSFPSRIHILFLLLKPLYSVAFFSV